ncbi:MAG TPA: hypothetical protein DDW52_07980 [Planctomycetaceae bacterium]|nr:hypothetical protein [Planctomycetaceae bacterium]
MNQAAISPSRGVSLDESVESVLRNLPADERTLWWIDSADVQATRQIIQLAELRGDDIHIGQSTSTRLHRRVAESSGWLGTTLAEATTHSQLVITLGSEIETEVPQLAKQLVRPESTWVHLGEWSSEVVRPDHIIPTAVSGLYALLTEVLLRLRYESLGQRDTNSQLLYSAIAGSDYTTVVWSADQFNDDLDELTLRRLVAISHLVSQTHRFCLLPIEANTGRVTANETLSWLTGYSPSASFDAGRWSSKADRTGWPLEKFRRTFGSIVMFRNVVTANPLPQVGANLSIVPAGYAELAQGEVVEISAVGQGSAGHLMRGDGALSIFCGANQLSLSKRHTRQPSALELLTELRERLKQSANGALDRGDAADLAGETP